MFPLKALIGGVVSAAGSALAFTCGSVADGTAGIIWGADVAPWEASGAAGGAGAGLGSGGEGSAGAGSGTAGVAAASRVWVRGWRGSSPS